MWSLKYEFCHKDCKYLPMADKLGVRLYTYPVSNYIRQDMLYISAIHIIEGDARDVGRYIKHLKSISLRLERLSGNTVFTLAVKDKNLEYYSTLYTPELFFPEPILHSSGKEYGHVLSWDKKNLVRLLKVLSASKHTTYFKLLHLKNNPLKNVFILGALDKITSKQRAVFEYALSAGYYNYPRRTSLDAIATRFNKSKSTCHEILRRCESNIFNSRFRI